MSLTLLTVWMSRGRASIQAGAVAWVVAAALVLGCLAWLSWSGMALREAMRLETARAVRVAELRGTIAYLNVRLVMSARLAAGTGEARWVDLYNDERPRLAAAIDEALSLTGSQAAADFVATTDEASHNLIAMERAAMARAAGGARTGATSLLDGPEFGYLQATYDSGMEAFDQSLARLTTARTAALNSRAWRDIFGLAGAAVLLVVVVLVALGQARLRAASARADLAARSDCLTSLPNRRHLLERLGQALTRFGEGDRGVALLLLDLDNFKSINDLHGHPAGDTLLQLVAARLLGVAHLADLVARLSGDEFAVILTAGRIASSRLDDAAARIAAQLTDALAAPFELVDGTTLRIGASIGVALAMSDIDTPDALIHRADIALHRAKAEQPGRFQFFKPGMDVALLMRASLLGDVRHAILADLIIPHFQPLVALGTGRIVGFEMLARWRHPVRGMVSPAEFVPIAEEIGLIGTMTDRLLRRACRIAMSWPSGVSLACNVSPLQLRDRELPAMIRAALAESRLPPHRLELEITESALVGDLDLARDILRELKLLGIRLALDDFGTGYSSLRHLQMLPFDTLKIDASFVSAMVTDVESYKIVSAVVGLGRSLDLSVVAEGIEEPGTAALLRSLDCDLGQGWLFGHPVSADEVDRLISATAPESRQQCAVVES